MEMPEGWNRVRKTNENLAEYNMESIDEALLLMKEMAEDLHLFQDIAKVIESPALKKFKEWK